MGDFLKIIAVDTLHFRSDMRESDAPLKAALVLAYESKVTCEYLAEITAASS